MPLRLTVAEVMTDGEDTLNVPVTGPVTVGANTIPTVQVEPGSRVSMQLFWIKANPALAESTSWPTAVPLVLLTVTVCAGLVEPTMTGANVNCTGLTLSPEVT